jgi:hypothetical protein
VLGSASRNGSNIARTLHRKLMGLDGPRVYGTHYHCYYYYYHYYYCDACVWTYLGHNLLRAEVL